MKLASSMEAIPRFAGIEDIKRTFHATPFSVYQSQYFRGSQGNKNTEREKIIAELVAVKNCAGRVLAFLAALCRQGFDGTLCPLDVISERLKRATGGKGEVRTIRRALFCLEELGYIHRAYHRTGAQIMTSKGLLNLQILRITFCPAIYQALGFLEIQRHRPKRPLHPKIEPREKQTFGRSAFPDGLTIGQTEKEKGNGLDGVELTPCGVHTSILLLQSAAGEEKNAQKASQPQTLPVKQTTEESPRLGTHQEFLQALFVAVENQAFAKKYYRESGPVAVLCSILTMAQNQNDPSYPEHWPKVEFDLMAWAIAPWNEQQKIIADYVERLKAFEERPDTITKTKACFLGAPLQHSFAVSVACLVVVGKMKFADVSQQIKQNFFFLKTNNDKYIGLRLTGKNQE